MFVDHKETNYKNYGKVYVARDTSVTLNIRKHANKCVVEREIFFFYLSLNQEKYKKICKIIIKYDYHLSFVEHERVKVLHCLLNPHAKTIFKNMTVKCSKLYEKEKENLKCYSQFIPDLFFCLTCYL